MKIYLSGPMRGIAEDNHPAFHAATSRLRLCGHQVYNPAEEEVGHTIRHYFNEDCRYICLEADAIAMLSGWERSRGACAELMLAAAIDLPLYLYQDQDPWLCRMTLSRAKIILLPQAASTTSPTLSRKLPPSLRPGTNNIIRERRSIGTAARARTMLTP
jgi:hypothetical protein